MKLIFVRSIDKEYDWFERENGMLPDVAWWFNTKDVRAWFLKWVFK